jgi:hypothetical protein
MDVTITEKLQKCTDRKEELRRIRQRNAVCVVTLVLSAIYKLEASLKLLSLCPGRYILA